MTDKNPGELEDQEVTIDDETSAAIERGIRAADAGRVFSESEVAAKIDSWILKSSTPRQR